MFHELPGGKLNLFEIDLSYLPENEFEAMQEKIHSYAFIANDYPGQQKMKVYWNYEESPDIVIGLPPRSVSLLLDSR